MRFAYCALHLASSHKPLLADTYYLPPLRGKVSAQRTEGGVLERALRDVESGNVPMYPLLNFRTDRSLCNSQIVVSL